MSAFYRTAIFIPTILSFVIVGFGWKLILSPIWGIAPNLLGAVGLKSLFAPWLGMEAYALTTLSLISVWQFVGIPMMLIYAALLAIPNEVLEAAECDGITGMAQFWKIKLPLILPSIGIISILTFVANFNAFDLIYSAQGALAGPNFSTDILGTFLYRTFFGFQLQLGESEHGIGHRFRHAADHPHRRLPLPVRRADAPAPLPALGAVACLPRDTPHARTIAAHAILIAYTIIALFPVFVILINSFKSRAAIFSHRFPCRTARPSACSAIRPSGTRAISCSISRTASSSRCFRCSACCCSARWRRSRWLNTASRAIRWSRSIWRSAS